MNNSSERGFKLTTVIFAVIIMAVTAMLSGNSVADDMDVGTTQLEEQFSRDLQLLWKIQAPSLAEADDGAFSFLVISTEVS